MGDFGGAADGKPDGALDLIVGYPADQAIDSDPFPCGNAFDVDCFGLYRYSGASFTLPQYRFRWVNNDIVLGASPTSHAVDHNNAPTTSRPHLEWTITGFNALRQRAGYPLIDVSGSTPWEFNILAFAGSFDDAGIGEDLLPGWYPERVLPL